MGKRISNPFPKAPWARQTYQEAGYMSVTMGYEFNSVTAEITVLPRFSSNKQPLTGSPGEVLGSRAVIDGVGTIPTERERLDLAFLLGYMTAKLEELPSDG